VSMIQRWLGGQSAQFHTLQLRRLNGRFLLPLAFCLLLYPLIAEVAIRQADGRLPLGVPSLGSQHTQFEQQWLRLQAYVMQRGAWTAFSWATPR
jgi:hypothetical protein